MTSTTEIADALQEIERLRTLVEASKLINSSIDTNTLFDSILSVARDQLNVERGTLYFVDDKENVIWSKIASGLSSTEIRLPIGRGIAGTVAATGELLLLPDAYSDPRFDPSSDQKSGFHTRSVLCVPIKNREGKIVGVLQLLNKRDGEFGRSDLEFLDSISDHMAIAMENATLHLAEIEKNRMEQELQLGREIQSRLFPKPPSDVKRTQFLGVNRPCYEVGGDYYDFIELPDGKIGITIADVSGKGVSAALIMSSVQSALRIAAPIEHDLPRLAARLNALVYRAAQGRKYVTFFFGHYDPESGHLTYVNAGHNSPLMISGSSARELDSTGRPIGLLPDSRYEAAAIDVPIGGTLVLYTDGFVEAENKEEEQFGMERWTELCISASAAQLEELPERLFDKISAFEEGTHPADDKTLVLLRRW